MAESIALIHNVRSSECGISPNFSASVTILTSVSKSPASHAANAGRRRLARLRSFISFLFSGEMNSLKPLGLPDDLPLPCELPRDRPLDFALLPGRDGDLDRPLLPGRDGDLDRPLLPGRSLILGRSLLPGRDGDLDRPLLPGRSLLPGRDGDLDRFLLPGRDGVLDLPVLTGRIDDFLLPCLKEEEGITSEDIQSLDRRACSACCDRMEAALMDDGDPF
jgi:hypothetical protein